MISELKRRILEQRKDRKRQIGSVVAIFALMLSVAVAVFFWISSFLGKTTGNGLLPLVHNKVNVLLLGTDERDGEKSADAIGVITIDTDSKKASLLWIPKDCRVKIPGYGWDKAERAYTYGGAKLAQKTVAELTGISLDYYIAMNTEDFERIVDKMNGVDINVEKRMYYYDPYDKTKVHNMGLIDLHSGLQHMNGNAALQFVRFRSGQHGDRGRMDRQCQLLNALLAKISGPGMATKLPELITAFNSSVVTDMPLAKMLEWSKMLLGTFRQGLHGETIPGRTVQSGDHVYWLPDIAAMRQRIGEIQGIMMDEKYVTAARDLAAEYDKSIQAETKTQENIPRETTAPPESDVSPANPKSAGVTDKQLKTGTPVQEKDNTKEKTIMKQGGTLPPVVKKGAPALNNETDKSNTK
jgi:LCP family protein required for cell wall assembly